MKIIYTLTLIMASLAGMSQITIDSSDFAIVGDTFTIVVGKNPANIDVKGGANSTWDFSKLTVDSLAGAKVRGIDRSKYLIDSQFPSADMKITSNSFGESYIIKTKDSLLLDGVANLELVRGNQGFTFNFTPNIKIMNFPLDYNDVASSITIIDTIVDTTITALSFDKIRIHVEFSFNSKVEGYGKLITSQDTLGVLKLYSEEGRSFKIYGHHTIGGWLSTPFITQNDTLHNYRWFAKTQGYQVAAATADEKDGTTELASYMLNTKKIFAYISNSNNPTCYGKSNGKATITAAGGSGNYSFKWSNGSGLGTLSNLMAGNHKITITDVISSKTFVSNVNLTDPDSLSTLLVSKKDEGALSNTGEIEITVTGGTPPYTYSWDKSSSNSTLASDLAGGNHKISVTDKNGCKKDTVVSIGSTLGLENNSQSELRIYPNPVKNNLTLVGIKVNSRIVVLDLTGKVVFSKNIDSNNAQLDMSSLLKGLYLIQIIQGQNVSSFRMVKN